MVYVTDWDEFCARSQALYAQVPEKVRYTMKYRHCDGKLVLKVTDDVLCLKYQTEEGSELKRVEQFNLNIMSAMASP